MSTPSLWGQKDCEGALVLVGKAWCRASNLKWGKDKCRQQECSSGLGIWKSSFSAGGRIPLGVLGCWRAEEGWAGRNRMAELKLCLFSPKGWIACFSCCLANKNNIHCYQQYTIAISSLGEPKAGTWAWPLYPCDSGLTTNSCSSPCCSIMSLFPCCDDCRVNFGLTVLAARVPEFAESVLRASQAD